MKFELSIVMPCLNEAETLERCILKAFGFLQQSGIAGEVVIGDNGSTDGSQEIARRLGARVIDVPVRGYGAAIYGAALGSQGKYLVVGDSDDSYDFSSLDNFVSALRNGADLVMGNRFKGGIKPGAMPWKNRYIGNPTLSGLGRVLFQTPIRDFHCGLRAISRDAFIRLDLRTTGMEFASEMVIKATLLGMNIVEVPTVLHKDGRSRPPHLLPWRDGWRHLRFMLLFSPNWLFLYPGILLMALGVIAGATLIARPVFLGGVHFSLGTLVYCAMVIEIGFQAGWFALLSQAYAVQEGLLPETWRTRFVDRVLSLENGIMLGLLLLICGFGLLVYAVTLWSNAKFGSLNVNEIVRIVVGSSLTISLGFQVILSSFLMSTLRLNVRAMPPGVFDA